MNEEKIRSKILILQAQEISIKKEIEESTIKSKIDKEKLILVQEEIHTLVDQYNRVKNPRAI
jgi:hypothetical protein